MQEQAEGTKTCPYCAEAIRTEAVVCRHCGRDLRPRETLHWYDFILVIAVILLPLIGLVWGGYLMLDERRRPRGCALFAIGVLASAAFAYLLTM